MGGDTNGDGPSTRRSVISTRRWVATDGATVSLSHLVARWGYYGVFDLGSLGVDKVAAVTIADSEFRDSQLGLYLSTPTSSSTCNAPRSSTSPTAVSPSATWSLGSMTSELGTHQWDCRSRRAMQVSGAGSLTSLSVSKGVQARGLGASVSSRCGLLVRGRRFRPGSVRVGGVGVWERDCVAVPQRSGSEVEARHSGRSPTVTARASGTSRPLLMQHRARGIPSGQPTEARRKPTGGVIPKSSRMRATSSSSTASAYPPRARWRLTCGRRSGARPARVGVHRRVPGFGR